MWFLRTSSSPSNFASTASLMSCAARAGAPALEKPYCYVVFMPWLLAIGDVVLMHVAGDETKLGADTRIAARAIGS
jgi:hypothetical protein